MTLLLSSIVKQKRKYIENILNSKIGNQLAVDFLWLTIDLSTENITIIVEVIAHKQIACESIVVEVI